VRSYVLVVALLGLAACASSGQAGYDPNAVRMCIENTTVGYGNVVAMVGSTRFTVYPGEEVCREVRGAVGGLSIRAGTTGGGATGPLRYAFTLPGGTSCWHWRVTSARTLDIVSCDQGVGY
jgi:hypothetical protein